LRNDALRELGFSSYDGGCIGFFRKVGSHVLGIDEQTRRRDVPKGVQKNRKDMQAKSRVRVELGGELKNTATIRASV
jgi:hypothetical protein